MKEDPGRIEVGVCASCNVAHHPVRHDCPACHGPVTIHGHPGNGAVVSWTRVERPPSGFDAPIRAILVRLDDLRAHGDGVGPSGPLALATTPHDDLLAIGTPVRLRCDDAGRLHAEPA
jgi:uncharacterized OB-fold protein